MSDKDEGMINVDPIGTISSPDALLVDDSSMAFYILRDESIALCKHRAELQYHKNRQTYLSSGRYSPQYKKVIFWTDSINARRGFELLVEHNHIESDYTYHVSGVTTRVTERMPEDSLDGLSNIRRAEVKEFLRCGLKIQKSNDNLGEKD